MTQPSQRSVWSYLGARRMTRSLQNRPDWMKCTYMIKLEASWTYQDNQISRNQVSQSNWLSLFLQNWARPALCRGGQRKAETRNKDRLAKPELLSLDGVKLKDSISCPLWPGLFGWWVTVNPWVVLSFTIGEVACSPSDSTLAWSGLVGLLQELRTE